PLPDVCQLFVLAWMSHSDLHQQRSLAAAHDHIRPHVRHRQLDGDRLISNLLLLLNDHLHVAATGDKRRKHQGCAVSERLLSELVQCGLQGSDTRAIDIMSEVMALPTSLV